MSVATPASAPVRRPSRLRLRPRRRRHRPRRWPAPRLLATSLVAAASAAAVARPPAAAASPAPAARTSAALAVVAAPSAGARPTPASRSGSLAVVAPSVVGSNSAPASRTLAVVAPPVLGAIARSAARSSGSLGGVATPVVGASRTPAARPGASLAGSRQEPGVGAGVPVGIVHVPPVDGPVVDAFRPPPGPYGPGNRGLEYDTEPGEPVRASAAGTVVFAGYVGGALHVTIRHADGVRTSYSFLSSHEVVLGQRVDQGEPVGAAGERLHFGARTGDAYFDPALLFGNGAATVELVPFEIPPGSSPEAEMRALRQIAFDGGGLGLPDLGGTARWLRDRAATATHYFGQLRPGGPVARATAETAQRLFFPGPCSDEPPPAAPVRGERRVAITVAGLGSSSTSGSIDELRTAQLGYARDHVVRFSYAGGKVPGTGEAVRVPGQDYGSADTQGDLRDAGRRLADLVVDVLAAEPDATVDLLAHSQGGIVVRLALLDLADRGVDLERLGLVATLGTPHRGADLATAVAGANSRLTGNVALDALEQRMGTGIDPDAESVAQLAETSELMALLRREGVPAGVELVSIAARSDWVVAAPNTAVDGATNVTVPVGGRHAHGDLVGAEATTDELARALAGQPPGCESAGDVVADVLVGHGISVAEDVGGAALQAPAP